MVAVREGIRGEADDRNKAISSRIRQDHRIIPELLEFLSEAVEPSRILDLVKKLSQVLPSHFSDEEGPDGLFEGLEAARPSNGARLRALYREHRQILEALEELCRSATELEQGLSKVLRARSVFVEQVELHEEGESTVVMDTHLVDEGGSG